MLKLIIALRAFVSAIILIILIHELLARLFKIKVKRFSIGFGRPFGKFYFGINTILVNIFIWITQSIINDMLRI